MDDEHIDAEMRKDILSDELARASILVNDAAISRLKKDADALMVGFFLTSIAVYLLWQRVAMVEDTVADLVRRYHVIPK